MPASKNMMVTGGSFIGGGIAGIALNDAWEIYQLPGYYANAFTIGDINVGYDDIAQLLVGLGISALGIYVFKSPIAVAGGLGVAAGGLATKIAEIMGYPRVLQIFKHEVNPPG